MIAWNPIFQRHITEHPRLQLLIVSSHSCFLPRLHCGLAVVFQRPPRAQIRGFAPRKMMRVLWVAQQRLQNRGRVRTYLLIGIAALLTTVIGVVGTSWLKERKSAMPVAATKNTIAVLPLQNMTGDNNLEYLRFALTDEIASV